MAKAPRTTLSAPDIRRQPVSVTRQMAASLPNLRAIAESHGIEDPPSRRRLSASRGNRPARVSRAQSRLLRASSRARRASTIRMHCPSICASHMPTPTRSGRADRAKRLRGLWRRLGPHDRSGAPHSNRWRDGRHQSGVFVVRAARQTRRVHHRCADVCGLSGAGDVEPARGGVQRGDGREGPIVARVREQIRAARAAGYFVPFYYSVPDGHNPAGFSFSDARRRAVLEVAEEEGILILEDAPYIYINYAAAEARPKPFVTLAPERTIHCSPDRRSDFPVRASVSSFPMRCSKSKAASRCRSPICC